MIKLRTIEECENAKMSFVTFGNFGLSSDVPRMSNTRVPISITTDNCTINYVALNDKI
jgi:hypothetical protein